MDNNDKAISIQKMEMRAALLLASAITSTILVDTDRSSGDAKFLRKLIEAEVEKIIETMWDKRRD
jgi:hypothetical protein